VQMPDGAHVKQLPSPVLFGMVSRVSLVDIYSAVENAQQGQGSKANHWSRINRTRYQNYWGVQIHAIGQGEQPVPYMLKPNTSFPVWAFVHKRPPRRDSSRKGGPRAGFQSSLHARRSARARSSCGTHALAQSVRRVCGRARAAIRRVDPRGSAPPASRRAPAAPSTPRPPRPWPARRQWRAGARRRAAVATRRPVGAAARRRPWGWPARATTGAWRGPGGGGDYCPA